MTTLLQDQHIYLLVQILCCIKLFCLQQSWYAVIFDMNGTVIDLIFIQVKCPNPGFDTLYNEWLYYTSMDINGTIEPKYFTNSSIIAIVFT